MRALVALAIIFASARAYAYPQFELSKDQSCSGCHISPSGGGLLSENGMVVAESISQFGTAPEFMYGRLKTPEWLALGGDFRGASGYLQTPQRYLVGFPMQAELYGKGTFGPISVHVNVGARPAEYGNEAATRVWSREHYVRWEQNPSAHDGIRARVGRFMPVFGLRLAEHPAYTRRFGGTPLYSDTYAAELSFMNEQIEAYVTGFVEDPLIDPVRLGNGASAFAQYRVAQNTMIGGGGMIEIADWQKKYRGTLVAKQYLPGPDVILQGEIQLVNPHVDNYGYKQIVSYLMASWFGPAGTMVDVGYGHYDENIGLHGLDRDAIDLNIHWFATSHIEAVLNNRIELIGKGDGGPTGAYSLLMAHYRL